MLNLTKKGYPSNLSQAKAWLKDNKQRKIKL